MPRLPKLTPRRLALAGLFIVLGLLAVAAQFTSGGGGPAQLAPTSTPDAATAAPTVSPTATPTSAAPVDTRSHDDGVVDPGPSSPTPPPDVREAAAAFAAAWLNAYAQTPQQWHDALAKRVTDDLAGELAGVDPRGQVPVGRVDDKVDVAAVGSVWEATVPIVERRGGPKLGVLTVLVVRDTNATFRTGQWLIAELDWEPQR